MHSLTIEATENHNDSDEQPLPQPLPGKATPPGDLTQYHLVLFQLGETSLGRNTVRRIQARLDQCITTDPAHTAIDIWLESPGGDAHAAYKLILDLKSRCVRLRAVVPDMAKSAATLLLLGVDEIFMAPAAELGPLDVQIEHPDRENVIVSGLDVTNSLSFLVDTAVDLTITGGGKMIAYTYLPRLEVLRATLHFMADLLQPVVGKLDSNLIYKARKELSVADLYAMNMLRCRNLPEDDHLPEMEASSLLKRLVEEYPVHGYIISRDEAEELGLPISPAEMYPRWDLVKALHNAS